MLSQCRKLAQLSADLETWNASEYSSFLRVTSRLTLSELNRLWTLYAATGSFTTSQEKQYKQTFVAGLRRIANSHKDSFIMTGARSAGPFYLSAYRLSAEAHGRFWETGVTFEQQKDIDSATFVNPTFAYATQGEGFVAHYGTCPLPAFHLAPALAPLDSSRPGASSQTIFDLFHDARRQFHTWCNAARSCITRSPGRVVLRFIIGDVLSVCHTLKEHALHGRPTAYERLNAWNASLLVLDEGNDKACPAPRLFNVIDTSNLVDHIGMLNILLATVPLLSRDPSATLLTETLLSSGEDAIKSFTERFCGDPNTVFALLDLVPSGYLSGFTTHSNSHETVVYAANPTKTQAAQYHERIVWKLLSLVSNDRPASVLALDPIRLAGLLHNIYLQMFAHENPANLLKRLTVAGIRDISRVHYCRRTFALMVQHLMHRVAVDWSRVLDAFFTIVCEDSSLLVGMNYYQELLCQLHMLGIHTEDSWVPGSPFLLMNKDIGRFSQWKIMPPVVCVVLSVPLSKVKILDELEGVSTPPLSVGVDGITFCNSFTYFQTTFGTVSLTGEHENTRVTIMQDPKGKYGASPFVVAFWAPTWMLCHAPLATSVSLGLVSTPATSFLWSKLGPQMHLYTAPLMDANKVHIVGEPPIVDSDLEVDMTISNHNKPPQHNISSSFPVVALDQSSKRMVTVTQRIEFAGSVVALALSRPETKVQAAKTGNFGVELSIGDEFKQTIRFPLIVDNSAPRLRVARKSSWVEASRSAFLYRGATLFMTIILR